MIDPATRRFAAVHLAIALVVASVTGSGCARSPGVTGAGSPTPSVPTTGAPSPTPERSVPASTSTSASAAPSASDPEASLEQPPGAVLVAGAASHPGEAGSWAWAGGTSDSPWLPARALERAETPAGAVTVELDDGVEVESWSAVAAAADDMQAMDVDALGDGSGTPLFEVPAGAWVVAVDVRFADGLGSAIYYWHLVVT